MTPPAPQAPPPGVDVGIGAPYMGGYLNINNWPPVAAPARGAGAVSVTGAVGVTAVDGDGAAERRDIASAARIVVKVGSSSLTTAEGGIDDHRIAALADALAMRANGGTQVVLVSSGAIAAGLAPLGLARRPRDLATQQAAASVGQGLLVATYSAAFAAAWGAHRAGAAERRRSDAPRPLPQRAADAEPAAGTGRAADRQRERHGGHRRDQVRRQRPAGRAGRARGAGRGADPAVRRGRAVRHRPAAAGRAADPRGAQPGRPGRGHPGQGRRQRQPSRSAPAGW